MKKCLYCGENIQESAKKCKHCGEWLAEKNIQDNEIKSERRYNLFMRKDNSFFVRLAVIILGLGLLLFVLWYFLWSNPPQSNNITSQGFENMANNTQEEKNIEILKSQYTKLQQAIQNNDYNAIQEAKNEKMPGMSEKDVMRLTEQTERQGFFEMENGKAKLETMANIELSAPEGSQIRRAGKILSLVISISYDKNGEPLQN